MFERRIHGNGKRSREVVITEEDQGKPAARVLKTGCCGFDA